MYKYSRGPQIKFKHFPLTIPNLGGGWNPPPLEVFPPLFPEKKLYGTETC
jgi:hypothetical protein